MSPSASRPAEAIGALETSALSVSIVATSVLGGGAVLWGVLSGAE